MKTGTRLLQVPVGSAAHDLVTMLTRAHVTHTVDLNMTKGDEPRSSFVVYTEHGPDRYMSRRTFVVYDFDAHGELLSVQVNQ